MGFLDQPEKTKKKRKRKKKSTEQPALPAKTFQHMIPIEKEWPPDTQERVLVYDMHFSFDVRPAFLVRQHLMHDNQTLGYFRVTHWYPLSNM